jgi:molecular chaperone GrpE
MNNKEEKTANINLENNTDADKSKDKNIADNKQNTSKDQVKEKSKKKKEKKTKSSEIEELNIKISELNNKYLRLSAEFDNYRKRTLKEKMDLTRTGGESILVNILPVVDNLERAIESIKTANEIDAVKDGINLINNNFKDFLLQNGIKEINAINKKFDTDLHEAISKIPAPKKSLKGKVVDVVEKGYFLHDKVVRFARVVIGE